MKIVVQRVSKASVIIENNVYSSINCGLLVFLGIAKGDARKEIDFLVDKILNLRIFKDEAGKMNKSVQEIEGEILIVSQFTLYGNCQKGRRPGFDKSAAPEQAISVYNEFVEQLAGKYERCQTGKFGASMQISLINDGPVTFILEDRNSV